MEETKQINKKCKYYCCGATGIEYCDAFTLSTLICDRCSRKDVNDMVM